MFFNGWFARMKRIEGYRLGLHGENACKLAIGGSRSSLSLASLDHQSTSILKLEQP